MPQLFPGSDDRNPVSVDEASVRLVLGALREGGGQGVLKGKLRDTLAEADDPALLPAGPSERQRWVRALDKRVERCLRRLVDDGARINRGTTPDGLARFTLEEGPSWDEHITAEARLALKLAALTLSCSVTDLWQERLELVEQLASKHMSNRDRLLFEQLEQVVKVYGGVVDPVPNADETLEQLLKAIQTRCQVVLRYQKAGASAATDLKVVPHAITHDIFSGGAYLLAWDPWTRSPRQYRLNRIDSVQLLETPGIIHQPEQMQRALDYQIGAWVSGEPPFEVVARIWGAGWIRSIQEAAPAFKDFRADGEGDGSSLLVRFKANHEEGPLRWLLQFGACAEVLSPSGLRERIRAELEETLATYRN